MTARPKCPRDPARYRITAEGLALTEEARQNLRNPSHDRAEPDPGGAVITANVSRLAAE